jgi:hypothetical protein
MSLQYQNPGTANAVLDSETIATDPTTGVPIVREFTIPEDSISGQTSADVLIPIMNRILTELRAIRLLMESEAAPQIVDEVDDVLALEAAEIEVEES